MTTMTRIVLRQRRESSGWYIQTYVHILRATKILLGSGIYMNFDWGGVGERVRYDMYFISKRRQRIDGGESFGRQRELNCSV